MNHNYFFEIDTRTDNAVETYRRTGIDIDHEKIADQFIIYLSQNYDDEDLCKLLSCAGFIPDSYEPDSSEETLFSKLIEVLVSEWANRMGFSGHFVREKSSYEDVNFSINGKIVVCDAKSFRLGRSQGAPNVKDFLKLQSFRDWLDRYDHPLGGLVTYPDTHEWAEKSDVYQHATTKECPIVILPYIYLALLLHYRDRYDVENLQQLWNYKKIFPKSLPKKMKGGNKKPYWNQINITLIKILGITQKDYFDYLNLCRGIQRQCIQAKLQQLEKKKDEIIRMVELECKSLDEKTLRKEFTQYRIKKETEKINALIKNINKFRLSFERKTNG